MSQTTYKVLIERQLKKMQYTKTITALRVRQVRPVKSAINLEPKDLERIRCNPHDNSIRIEMLFNSLMTEFFKGSDIVQLIACTYQDVKEVP